MCADKKGPRPPEQATPGRPNPFVRSHRALLAIFLVLILRYPATDSLSATYTLTYFTSRLVATVRAPTHDQLLFKVDQKNKLPSPRRQTQPESDPNHQGDHLRKKFAPKIHGRRLWILRLKRYPLSCECPLRFLGHSPHSTIRVI